MAADPASPAPPVLAPAVLAAAERHGLTRVALEEALHIQAHGAAGLDRTLAESAADAVDALRGKSLADILVALGKLTPDLRDQLAARGKTQADVADTESAFLHLLGAPTLLRPGPDGGTDPAPLDLRRFGRYQDLVELGRGGMGVVYRATDPHLGRQVALKVLPAGDRADSDSIRRFQREASAAAGLHHPGIVQVYDVGEHEGRTYYTMELVPGKDLAQAIRDKELSLREIVDVTRQVAEAMTFAHARGILHRDLKPGNILLQRDGQSLTARVLDFGLAKTGREDRPAVSPTATPASGTRVRDRLTQEGRMLGTPLYMAPEQFERAADVDARADVYSLGVTLYEMLTGWPPFRGAKSLADLLAQVRRRDPLPPRKLRKEIDADLETLCLKCLQKAPWDRYAGAGPLAEDCRSWLAGEPIAARPVNAVEQVWHRVRRYRALSMLAAAFALCAVAGLALYVRNLEAERDRTESARREAEDRGREAERLRGVAETEARQGRRRLAELMTVHGFALARDGRWGRARGTFADAHRILAELGEGTLPAAFGYGRAAHESPEPLAILEGHAGAVTAAALGGNGLRAATGGADGKLRVWDALTGVALQTVTAHPGGVAWVGWDAEERGLFTAGRDGTWKAWSAEPSLPLRTCDAHAGGVTCAGWLGAAGSRLVTGGADGRVVLWDAQTGTLARTIAEGAGPVHCLAVAPDGTRVAAGIGEAIVLWTLDGSVASETLRSDAHPLLFETHAQTVGFSADGRRLIGGYGDGTVEWWSVSERRLEATRRPLAGGVSVSCRVPGNGGVLLGGTDGRVLRGEPEADHALLHAHGAPVTALAVTERGIFTGSGDGRAAVWGRGGESLEERAFPDFEPGLAQAMGFSADGRLVWAIPMEGAARVWDRATGREVARIAVPSDPTPAFLSCGELAPDNRHFALGTARGLVVWDLLEDRPVRELSGFDLGSHNAVAFTPDGRLLLAGHPDGDIRIWETATGAPAGRLDGLGGSPVSVRVSPDGHRVAAGGAERMGVWDLPTRTLAWSVDATDGFDESPSFSPDSTRVVCCVGDRVEVRDAATGKPVRVLHGLDRSLARSAFRAFGEGALAPDGRTLITADSDTSITLWSLESGQEIAALHGFDALMPRVRLSSDGLALLAVRDREGSDILMLYDLARAGAYLAFRDDRLPAARAALAGNANDARALHVFAEWYGFRGEWARAMRFARMAEHAGAGMPPVLAAQCQWRLGEADEARRHFERALAQVRNEQPLGPARTAAENHLRLCLRALGRGPK